MFIGGRRKGTGGCERGRQEPVLLADLREENLAAAALGCVDWKSWRFAGSNNGVITSQSSGETLGSGTGTLLGEQG